MTVEADRLVDLATTHVAAAERQADPATEFHLRRASVQAQVATARYLRTINESLAIIARSIDRGAERVAPSPRPSR